MNEMIHRKRLHILTFLLLIASNQTHGQSNEKEKEAVRRSRLDKVEFYHTGVGIEMGAIHNFVFGPLVYAGIYMMLAGAVLTFITAGRNKK